MSDEEDNDGVQYMTTEEWRAALSCGAYNEYDGSAYWVIGGVEQLFDGFDPPPSGATGVNFYGK